MWKLDLLGTIKRGLDKYQVQNPTDAYVTGSGSTDLTIVDMAYELSTVKINDPSTRFLLQIKNNGQTTVQKFLVFLDINNTEVYANVIDKQLLPGQEIVLSLPITDYWDPSIVRSAGQYRTDIAIGVSSGIETNLNDNSYYDLTDFQ
jgi:hypothetical protein